MTEQTPRRILDSLPIFGSDEYPSYELNNIFTMIDQDDIDKLHGVLAGTVPPDNLNLTKILNGIAKDPDTHGNTPVPVGTVTLNSLKQVGGNFSLANLTVVNGSDASVQNIEYAISNFKLGNIVYTPPVDGSNSWDIEFYCVKDPYLVKLVGANANKVPGKVTLSYDGRYLIGMGSEFPDCNSNNYDSDGEPINCDCDECKQSSDTNSDN